MGGPAKKYNVAEVVAEARLKKPAIILSYGEDENGVAREFKIPDPALWGDDVLDAAASGKAHDLAHALLEDQYDAWRAAGGQMREINLVLEAHRANVGESSPSLSS